MNNYHTNRIKKLSDLLKEHNIDLAIILQNVDLYYLTGTLCQGALVINQEGKYIFAVAKPYARAVAETSLEKVTDLGSMRYLPEVIAEFSPEAVKTSGFELDTVPWKIINRIKKQFSDNLKLKDISPLLKSLRALKDDDEIKLIRKSGDILSKTFAHLPQLIRVGKTELEIAADLESFMRKLGHQGFLRVRKFNMELYYGSLGTGSTVAYPTLFDGPVGNKGLYKAVPYFCSQRKVKAGDTFMVDIMAGYKGYLADATRTYHLPPYAEHIKKAHEIAIGIDRHTRILLKPGTSPEQIYLDALKIAEKHQLDSNFMGFDSNRVKFLGHGVGLEIDELPVLAKKFVNKLQAGNVIAVEPKFFFANGAAGIENTYIINENGFENVIDYPNDLVLLP
ncbi:MAG: Xaa-Pro peptidase family protein [Deltaproteobacteria bacterium]|jgi:Xaa-Pro dipeptidase|nr:Xaa-Pro peptidase family protein [Deltaproteobacteria bacterium]